MNIGDFRDVWAGRPCAIIANGPSVHTHDLARIRIPMLGVNRVVTPTDYHLVCDWPADKARQRELARIASVGRLFVLGDPAEVRSGWIPVATGPIGIRLPVYLGRREPWRWSFDLTEGAVESHGPTGSVVYVALQLACWMGSREIYVVGLDLDGGGHCDGSPSSDLAIHQEMDALFHRAEAPLARLVAKVMAVEPSRCTAFEHVPFSAVLEAAR